MTVALITIAVILILYGAVPRPFDARGITSATAHVVKQPSAAEAKPTIMSRLRHHPTPEESAETEAVTTH